ncbi:leukocyte elastase inhibitor-like [Planococcus citri]|uniref:leukocyte elastase inhibitor-like n=1 Tax=Planococcus citri TaxID=170843 RepID=UPI0031F7DC67
MKNVLWIISLLEVLIGFSQSRGIPDANHEIVQNGLLNFGVKLNSILLENNTENENILFSPFNLYTSLALVHLGSNGTTRDTISNLLGIPETNLPKNLHEVLRNFSSEMQTIPLVPQYNRKENGTTVTGGVKMYDLKLSNGIFVQNKYKDKLKKDYVEDVKQYHNGDIFDVDFVIKREETIDTINKYVSNKTENRIPQLFKKPLSQDTLMLITSTLYYKAFWPKKFERELTKTDTFYTDKGNITVQMMNGQLEGTAYANISSLGVEVINLPFYDQIFSMFIVMPYENQPLEKFLSNLTAAQMHQIIDRKTYHWYYVDLKLPKTAFKWSKSVKKQLVQLGLTEGILESPELTGMIEDCDIKISEIKHSTDIKIDEDGLEASAFSYEEADLRVAFDRKKKATFHVNRPFFFFIYNHDVNVVLFFGTVFDPNGKE